MADQKKIQTEETETGVLETEVPKVPKGKRLVKVFQEADWLAKRGFLAGGVILIVLFGIGTGYLLATRQGSGGIFRPGKESTKVYKGMEVGRTDTETFRDIAEGILEKGGIEGEGTHKLIREGGPSQTAYLTSSIVNLDDFIGRKVKVWGETFKGQKAGWLMDVGKVKVLE